jgi:hypothetical protein
MAGIYSSSRPEIDELLFMWVAMGALPSGIPQNWKGSAPALPSPSAIKWYLHTYLAMNSLYFSLLSVTSYRQEIPSR